MRSRHVLRTMGLSLMAAMSLVAAMATGAEAVAGEFRVLGSAALATGQTFGGGGFGTPRLLVPALNLEIACERFAITNGTIISGPAGTASATILLENCVAKALSPLETLTTCEISNGGLGLSRHITITTVILSVLHSGVKYLLAEQNGKGPLAKIEFKKGIGCTLPSPVEMTGSIAFETTQFEVFSPTFKAGSEALQTLLGDELKFGKNKALLDGEAPWGIELTSGPDLGCAWGAV